MYLNSVPALPLYILYSQSLNFMYYRNVFDIFQIITPLNIALNWDPCAQSLAVQISPCSFKLFYITRPLCLMSPPIPSLDCTSTPLSFFIKQLSLVTSHTGAAHRGLRSVQRSNQAEKMKTPEYVCRAFKWVTLSGTGGACWANCWFRLKMHVWGAG